MRSAARTGSPAAGRFGRWLLAANLPLVGCTGAVGTAALAEPPAGPPAAPAAASSGAPTNGLSADTAATAGLFSVLGSTDTGKTLFVLKKDAKTLGQAIRATADDLAPLFDAKPALGDAFADGAAVHRRGGASFTAKLKGQEVKGLILVGLGADGAAAGVVYDRTDAPPGSTAALFAALPAQAKMRPQPVPDGSGTVDLPPGWKMQPRSSFDGGIVIDGPDGQQIGIGTHFTVATPDGTFVRTVRQTQQQYEALVRQSRQFGRPPPPPPQVKMPPLVAPFTGPEQLRAVLTPQVNEAMRAGGGPVTSEERTLETAPAPAWSPGGKAALLYGTYTSTQGDTATRRRYLGRCECAPVGDGRDAWSVFNTYVQGPDATFDRDRPLMYEVGNSYKVDERWLANHIRARGEALRQQAADFNRRQRNQFETLQQQHREQASRFDRMNAAEANRQRAVHASNLDAVEMYSGFRDVYDTRTGTHQAADYYHVDGYVNALNEQAHDPARYVQIPLRDLP